jgi:hypothetical protein
MKNNRTDETRLNNFNPQQQHLWDLISLISEETICKMFASNATLFELYEYARLQRQSAAYYLGHSKSDGFGIIRNSAEDLQQRSVSLEFFSDSQGAPGSIASPEYFFSMKKILQNQSVLKEEQVEWQNIPDLSLSVDFKSTRESIKIDRDEVNPDIYIYSMNKLNALVEKIRSNAGLEALDALALLTYKLCRMMPLVGGSAAISAWIARGLAKAKGFDSNIVKMHDLSFDVYALIQGNSQVFCKDFTHFFTQGILQNNYKNCLATALDHFATPQTPLNAQELIVLSHFLSPNYWQKIKESRGWKFILQQLAVDTIIFPTETMINLPVLAQISNKISAATLHGLIAPLTTSLLIQSTQDINDLKIISEIFSADKVQDYVTQLDENILTKLLLKVMPFDESTVIDRLPSLEKILVGHEHGKKLWERFLRNNIAQSVEFLPDNARELRCLEDILSPSLWQLQLQNFVPENLVNFAASFDNSENQVQYLQTTFSTLVFSEVQWGEALEKMNLTWFVTPPEAILDTLKKILTEKNWGNFVAALNKLDTTDLQEKGIPEHFRLPKPESFFCQPTGIINHGLFSTSALEKETPKNLENITSLHFSISEDPGSD